MASFAPIKPPKALQMAIGMATAQIICPFSKKRQMDPALVAKLMSLALALAFRKSKPKIVTNPKIKNVPVAGPINPS